MTTKTWEMEKNTKVSYHFFHLVFILYKKTNSTNTVESIRKRSPLKLVWTYTPEVTMKGKEYIGPLKFIVELPCDPTNHLLNLFMKGIQ